jgi:hypothetical protein
MTWNKNARKLFYKFMPREGTMRVGRTEYYIFDGFKFEKTKMFDNKVIYRVYSTYYDHYQEVAEEAILEMMLKRSSLSGLMYEITKVYNERNTNKFIEKMKSLLDD